MFRAPGWMLVAVGSVVLGSVAPRAEILEQILVKVNGDIITKTEFEQKQVLALRQRGVQPSATEDLKKAIADVTPQLIVDAVDELLLLQRGKELGYKLGDEQFQQVVEQIRKENKLDTEDAFQAALKQEGMTMADLRKSLEKQMIISRVQSSDVMAKVNITEEEGRRYHAEHKEEFTRPGTATLREIFVNVPSTAEGVNAAAAEEARIRIEELRTQVLAGEAFERVAAESSDAPSKANGGLIGPLNLDELSKPIQDMLAKMKPGDVTGVLRTPRGYQVLKLETMTPPTVLEPEQVRDQIMQRLYDQRRRVELQKYLVRLREQAIIEWKNDELRKAYESALGAKPGAAPAEGAEPDAPAPPPAAPPAR